MIYFTLEAVCEMDIPDVSKYFEEFNYLLG